MKIDDEKLLPEDIRRIRMELGLTQEQAGERIGGGRRAFSKYESGSVQPSAAVINFLRILDRNPHLMTEDGRHAGHNPRVLAQNPNEVSADDVRLLSNEQFADLLRRLLQAEALSNGISLDGVHVASNMTAPDGGEDARIFWDGGVERTVFLPSRTCRFQMKTGRVTPAIAGQEMTTRGEIKAMVRGVIEAGGNYVMLSTQPVTGQGIEARERKMREAIRDAGIAVNDDQVAFKDGSQIATWVNWHPSIATWLSERVRPGSVGPFATYEGWSRRREHHAASFADDSRLPELRERIRSCAAEPGSALRVVGLSGVGKSRLVHEVLGNEAEEALVMYAVDSENPAGAVQSTVNQLSDSQRRAVVVVDECDIKTHRQLVGMVSRAGSRISLVTIDDELPRNVSDNATFVVADSPVEVVESIIDELLPGSPNEDKRRLSRFANGFPAVAVRMARVWEVGVPIAHSTDDDLVDRFVSGRSPLDRELLLKSAQLVSVFGLVGWEHPIANQTAEVAHFDGFLTDPQFRQGISDLLNRGIIRQRGRCVSLQPKPIAMNLAERQWQQWYGDKWDEVLTGSTNSELKVFAARQLALINPTGIAKQVAGHVCRLDGPLSTIESLTVAGHPEVICSLAEVDRDAVARLIAKITNDVGDPELVIGRVRRNFVDAAAKIVFHPDSFESGADLLLELAASENERWGNNASGIFEGLFQLYLGGTAADGDARIIYLERALVDAEPKHRVALAKALSAAACLGPFDRMMGAESHGSLEALKSWQPETNGEIVDYISGSVKSLTEIAIERDGAALIARKELGSHFRSLVRGGFIDLVAQAAGQVQVATGDWPDGLRNLTSILAFDDDLPGDVIERVRNLVEDLQPTDLVSQVEFLVTDGISLGSDVLPAAEFNRKYEQDVRSARQLAEELSTRPEIAKSCFPSLVRGQQHMAYEFGKSLGELSDDPLDWLKSIIETMMETDPREANHDLLVGYLKGMQLEHSSEVAKMKQILAGSEFFAPAFATLCSRLGEISHLDVNIALNALDDGHLRPHHLRSWAFGGILAETPVADVVPLFDALIDHSPQGMAECADLMGMYVWGAPEKLGDLSSQVIKLAEKSDDWGTDRGRRTDDYRFQELMKSALNRGRNDGLGRSIALGLSKSFVKIDGYRSHRLFEPILPLLLSGFPEIAWPIIGQAIVADERTAALLMFELGGGMSFSDEPDSAILNLPEDVLFAWCYANPEGAPAFAARNLPFLTTLDRNATEREIHPRMLRLIDEFGHREDVREEIAANTHTFGWSGSTTEYYEMFYEPLAGLADHQNRDVRRWATQVRNELKDAFERAKNEDEEREARSEFY